MVSSHLCNMDSGSLPRQLYFHGAGHGCSEGSKAEMEAGESFDSSNDCIADDGLQTCYICNQKMGACIQCGSKNCFQAFHVTCARRAKLFLKMKSHHGGPSTLDASVLKAFCDKHAPSEWQRVHDVERSTITAKDYYRRVMKGRRWADSQQSALAILPSHQTRTGAADGESRNRNTGNDSAATTRAD